jgi:hypothetical protein
MTELPEKAIEAVRRLAPEVHGDITHVMLHLAWHGEPGPIEPDDLAAVLEGLAHAGRGDFASDAEVKAAFRRFG